MLLDTDADLFAAALAQRKITVTHALQPADEPVDTGIITRFTAETVTIRNDRGESTYYWRGEYYFKA